MSTVLWANVEVDGQVVSEQQERHALCRHADTQPAADRFNLLMVM